MSRQSHNPFSPRTPSRKHALLGGAAAIAIASVAFGQSKEHEFLTEAAQGNLAEIQLGELAVQRAANPRVREFGELLRMDHSAALKRTAAVAKSLQAETPTEPTTEAKRHYDGLAQLSGSQFDAAFVSHMITAHEAAIANYSSNASSDHDGVAALVAEALPTLRAHLTTAQALQRGEPAASR